MCGVERQCSDCGQYLAPSQFERLTGGAKISYRKNCKKCRSAYNRAAQMVARAKRAQGIPARSLEAWGALDHSPYVPPRDFLPMGDATPAALVWSVGRRVELPAYEQRWAA